MTDRPQREAWSNLLAGVAARDGTDVIPRFDGLLGGCRALLPENRPRDADLPRPAGARLADLRDALRDYLDRWPDPVLRALIEASEAAGDPGHGGG